MKKIKIIGISVALLGVAASVGTAIALYQTNVDPIAVNIGAGSIDVVTSTDSITYKAGTPTVDYGHNYGSNEDKVTGGSMFDSTHDEMKVQIPLSASYPSDAEGVIPQQSMVGKLTMTITPNANISNNVTFEVWAGVKGYANGNFFANSASPYLTQVDDNGTPRSENANFTKAALTAGDPGSLSSGVYSVSGYAPVTVLADNVTPTTSNTQSLEIWVKVGNLNASEALAANENLFDIAVNWGSADDYHFAYVVGYKNNWSTYKEYRMMPSIAGNDGEFVWKFANLSSFAGDAKCVKVNEAVTDGTSAASYTQTVWSDDPNASLGSGSYNVSWSGSGAATFAAI